jgi:Polyketide cyclase / dehydrase and lipid transport
MAKTRSVSRTRFIKALPEAIFEVVSNPAKHALIDGSGTVQSAAQGGPATLIMGTEFGMNMKLGVPYKMQNTVVEFEPGQLIAWRHFGGHRWRWQIAPAEGGAMVTETFDWAGAKSPFMLELARYPARNAKAIEKSLIRLAELLEPKS